MTLGAKRFFFIFLGSTGALVLLIVGVNVYVDVFGIVGWDKDRPKRVYGEERRAKFLLAHNYIPQNYDAIILGPSLAGNLDPDELKPYKFYNASVLGGRISVIRKIYNTLKENGGEFEVALISLNPFLTNETDYEDDEVWKQTYRSAFGSFNLLKYYGFALIRTLELLPSKYPLDKYDINGKNNFENEFKVPDVRKRILQYADELREENFLINPEAADELRLLATDLANEDGTVVFYFHPMPREVYERHRNYYDRYFEEVRTLVDPIQTGVILANFNTDEFASFTSNYENYIDHWHFSPDGQKKFLEILKSQNFF